MRLVLEAERSSGPRVAVSAQGSPQRFLSIEGPAGATFDLDDDDPAVRIAHFARVRLAQQARRGDGVELRVEWESDGGSTSQSAVHRRAALASWVTVWHPLAAYDPNEPVSLSAKMSAPGPTTFRLPSGWSSVSNGKLDRRDASEQGTVETWTVDPPVARSFAAGPHRRAIRQAGARTIGVYTLTVPPEKAERQARTMADALRAQEAVFGPYPYPTYGIVEVPEPLGDFYASSEQGEDQRVRPRDGIEWWATRADDGAFGAHVELEQRQPGEPYRLDVELGLHLDSGEVVYRTVDLSTKSAVHELPTGTARVLRIELDPDRKLLVWRPYYGSPPWIRG